MKNVHVNMCNQVPLYKSSADTSNGRFSTILVIASAQVWLTRIISTLKINQKLAPDFNGLRSSLVYSTNKWETCSVSKKWD